MSHTAKAFKIFLDKVKEKLAPEYGDWRPWNFRWLTVGDFTEEEIEIMRKARFRIRDREKPLFNVETDGIWRDLPRAIRLGRIRKDSIIKPERQAFTLIPDEYDTEKLANGDYNEFVIIVYEDAGWPDCQCFEDGQCWDYWEEPCEWREPVVAARFTVDKRTFIAFVKQMIQRPVGDRSLLED